MNPPQVKIEGSEGRLACHVVFVCMNAVEGPRGETIKNAGWMGNGVDGDIGPSLDEIGALGREG